jgi:hypothetical protein
LLAYSTEAGVAYDINSTVSFNPNVVYGQLRDPMVFSGEAMPDDPNRLPSTYALNQNFPNPFNPTTTIRFALPTSASVRINIYNVAGQLVRTGVNEPYAAGFHQYVWNGTDNNGNRVASGVYFYEMKAGGFREVKKMVMLK